MKMWKMIDFSMAGGCSCLGAPLLGAGDADGSEVDTDGGLAKGLRMLDGA